jgi:hypothetical protein
VGDDDCRSLIVVTLVEVCRAIDEIADGTGVKAILLRNPMAGLVAIQSARSCSAWVEIRITDQGAGRPDR